MSTVTETTEDFLRDLGTAARNNPISAALIGMGVLWMMTGGTRSTHRIGSLFGQLPEVARDTMDAASSGLQSVAARTSSGVVAASDALTSATSSAYSQAAHVGGKIVDQASDSLRVLPDVGAEMYGSARSSLNELFRAQPLALGVIGLGIGASIAAALPTTSIEQTYMGETSNQLMSQAGDFVGEKLDQAMDTAHDVVDAVASEAKKQGFTADGVKSAVGQATDKLSRVAESTVSGTKPSPIGSRT